MKRPALAFTAAAIVVTGFNPACAASLNKETVEAALTRALSADPAKQDIVSVAEEGDYLVVAINRDALTSASGINFFSRYLPAQFKLKLSEKGGYGFNMLEPTAAFSTDGAMGDEAGKATVGEFDIRGIVPFGLMGQAVLSAKFKDIAYKSDDGLHETTAKTAGLNVYRNQQFFSPSTLQLMYSLSGVTERAINFGGFPFELRMGSMLYTMLIGATDTTPVVKALWDGEPFITAVFPADEAPFRDMLSKARAFETSYSASNVTYAGYPLGFGLQNFTLKYQSRQRSGSEGGFDIGLDYFFIRDSALGSVLGEFFPEHVWFSGDVTGIDYHDLIASKNAMLNPFADELQFVPDFRKIRSFHTSAFKFAGFDETRDFAGSGTLTLKNGERPLLSGKITLRLKQGRERFEAMLARRFDDLDTEMLRYRLQKAFATGKKDSDGALSFDIDIADNAVSVGGQRIW